MTNLIKIFAKIISYPLIAVLSFAGYSVGPSFSGTSNNPGVSAVFETSLSAPIQPTDTSMTLASNVVDSAGDTLPNVYTCFTLDQGNPNNEFVCGTVSGTSVTSLNRGVSPLTGTTTISALGQQHRRGTDVKITDWPTLGIVNNQLNGQESIPNLMQYSTNVLINSGSASSTIATKAYIDSVSIAGAANSSETVNGISQLATQLQSASSTATGSTGANLVLQSKYGTSSPSTLCGLCTPITQNNGKLNQSFLDLTQTFPFSGNNTYSGTQTFTGQNTFSATSTMATTTQNGAMFGGNIVNNFTGGETIAGNTLPVPVMLATTSDRVYKVDGDVASTTNFFGFVLNGCSVNTTCYVQTDGIVGGFTGLTLGSEYYVSDTAGVLATTPGTTENYVGRAVTSSQILIDHARNWQYNGSISLNGSTQNIAIPQFTRFIVIDASMNYAPSGTTIAIENDMTLSKTGKTTAVLKGSTCCTLSNGSITATWTNNTLAITLSTSVNDGGTVYFYR